jgi:hypothetical protein
MKVKTLRNNVLTLNEKGTILEVSAEEAKRLEELGAVEIVKAPKKATTKKAEEEK